MSGSTRLPQRTAHAVTPSPRTRLVSNQRSTCASDSFGSGLGSGGCAPARHGRRLKMSPQITINAHGLGRPSDFGRPDSELDLSPLISESSPPSELLVPHLILQV